MKNVLSQALICAAALLPLISQGAIRTVQITDSFQFSPDKITIRVGDSIEFVNNSQGTHTVTANPALAKRAGDVILPPGAAPFHSGFLNPDAHFLQVFRVTGHYQYVCLPHELMGMKGQIDVLPAGR